MNENKVLSVLSTIFIGLFGGMILAGIQLTILRYFTYQLDLIPFVLTCGMSMVLPACFDVFAKYNFPVWISECMMPIVSFFIGVVYLQQSAMNQTATNTLFQSIFIFNICVVLVVMIRIIYGVWRGKKNGNQ